MLPAKYRLVLRQDREFFPQARRQSSPVGLLYFVPSEAFRATVIAPKNSFSRSIDRHVAKRRLASALKTLLDTQKPPAIKLVIVAHKSVLTTKHSELVLALETATARLKV